MSTELLVRTNHEIAERFMPVFTAEAAMQRFRIVNDFVRTLLNEGTDFGKVPGTDKNTLLKPGAEKLCTFFGLVPAYEYEQVEEDWGTFDREPLFSYRIKCTLWRNDEKAGEGMGFCSSRESKYRWRWVDEATVDAMGLNKERLVSKRASATELSFAIERGETGGKYGKPPEYWEKWRKAIADGRAHKIQKPKRDGSGSMDAWEVAATNYRVPNPDIADQVNTILKMAMKRAHVAATIIAVNVSDRFTQDIEDYVDVEHRAHPEPASDIDTGGHPVGTQAAADYVRDKKLEQIRNEEHTKPAEGGEQAQPAGKPDTTVPVKAEGSSAPVSNHAPSTPTPSTAGHNIHPQHDTRGVSRPVAPAGIDVADASANGTTVKSPTPPPAGSVRHVPEALQPLLKRMGKSGAEQKAILEKFREGLVKFLGDDEGNREFAAALTRNGALELSDVHLLSVARKIAIELYPLLEPHLSGVPA